MYMYTYIYIYIYTVLYLKKIHFEQGPHKDNPCAVGSLCRSLCRDFAFLVRSLCVDPCAGSLWVIFAEVCGPGNFTMQAIVSKSLCVPLCSPCALLVHASSAHWAGLRP